MKKLLALVPAAFIGTAAFASSPVRITDPELSGDCEYDDIQVVQEEGRYFIAAFFSDMTAQTSSDDTSDKKRCTMKYNVDVEHGYKLDIFQFSVDGVYQLSESGTARLTVSHRVLNGKSVRTTAFYSAKKGDPLFGDITDHTGDITRWDLEEDYQKCGASIPLTTSIYAQAIQAKDDYDFTFVDLDEGVSSAYTRLGEVHVDPCY